MSERLDPEEVTTIMNNCFVMMGKIVETNSGIIDKFIGDCIMMVFGVPAAIENAPLRAVNCAFEMRNKLYQFNEEELEVHLDIHVGINTGEVISGAIGSEKKKEYTVMGDAVNLAARLEDISEAGQILVGQSTYRFTRNLFEYKELAQVSLKGKEKAVQIYELICPKMKKVRDRLYTSRLISSELVGRQRELDQLELYVLKAINGEGSIVNVVGEAGIGKSRLIAELKRKDEIRRVILLEGRALSMGKNLSFHPIIEILKNWAGIKEEDGETDSMHKIERLVDSIHTDERSEIVPFIATLMGLRVTPKYAERLQGLEGESLFKLIIKNLMKLLTKASGIKPLVIIIDDLH